MKHINTDLNCGSSGEILIFIMVETDYYFIDFKLLGGRGGDEAGGGRVAGRGEREVAIGELI